MTSECVFKNKCIDVDSENCKTCMNNVERSYYIPYSYDTTTLTPPEDIDGNSEVIYIGTSRGYRYLNTDDPIVLDLQHREQLDASRS